MINGLKIEDSLKKDDRINFKMNNNIYVGKVLSIQDDKIKIFDYNNRIIRLIKPEDITLHFKKEEYQKNKLDCKIMLNL